MRLRIVLFSYVLFILVAFEVHAAPFFGIPTTITQPDGTFFFVKLYGDEFYNEAKTLDGITLIRSADGDRSVVYAILGDESREYISSGIVYEGENYRDVVNLYIGVEGIDERFFDIKTTSRNYNHHQVLMSYNKPEPFKPNGEGTTENPYVISNINELIWITIRDTVDGLSYQQRWAKHYIQSNDIDASETKTWEHSVSWNDTIRGWRQIGYHDESYDYNFFNDEAVSFTGTYDGKGHKISNLEIVGIATLEEVKFLGFFGAIGETGVVKNLGVENVEVNGGYQTGGLVGHNRGLIENCYVTGNIKNVSHAAGGLAGVNAGVIAKSYTSIDVKATLYTGGFVGANYGTIRDCYSTGKVDANNRVGGFVGVYRSGDIDNCYSAVEVIGEYKKGGAVGFYNSPIDSIPNNINNVYWAIEISELESVGGLGLINQDMVQQSSFENWDFESVWTIDEGESFPYLSWQREPVVSVENNALNFSVSLGPNPIQNTLQITITDASEYIGKEVNLSVYSSNGRKYKSNSIKINSVDFVENLDINNMDSGVCILVLDVDGFDSKREIFTKVK